MLSFLKGSSMSENKPSVTNKLEDLFLGILRNVILVVLAISLLGALFLAVAGIADLGAKPKEYKYEKFDAKDLVKELKDSLQEQPSAKPDTKPEPAKKPSAANDGLEDELNKQTNFIVQFYKKYDFSVNSGWLNEQYKPRQRRQARSLGVVYGEGEAAQLEYIKGQTQVYEAVLMNPELNQLLDKKFKSQGETFGDERYQVVHDFANRVMTFYPEFHENQIKQKQAYEAEQAAHVAMRNAGAMMKLYIAGGVFAAFLLISLILVLVKIERNLRVVKLEEHEVEVIRTEA